MRLLWLVVALALAGCDNKIDNHTVVKIKEASGISYCANSDTMVVANDEGSFYEIDKNGAIVNQKTLGKYDLEGVVCEDDRFVFAIEDGRLLTVERDNLAQNIITIDGMEKLDKKSGIEGITKKGAEYILATQSKNKDDARLVILSMDNDKATVVRQIHSGIEDSSGLEYADGTLYIVSDAKDKLYLYDLQSEKIVKKIDLPPFAVEGVALDGSGNIWFSDDDGAVLRYGLGGLLAQ